jgi:hypothetical protein
MARARNLFRLIVVGHGQFDNCEYLSHVHAHDGLELRFGRYVDGKRLPEQRIPATLWHRYELVKQDA